ncbi:MAG: hypothetical protein ACM33T_01730 [Solirubrobacterales bacterium]
MRRGKFTARSLSPADGQPFATAEEAWLWFARCQIARLEGVRFVAGAGEVARPCDPDDIYRAVDALARSGAIGHDHVTVLGRFGLRLAPPDPWAGDGAADAARWQEAMARLEAALKAKGIVA